MTGSPPTFSVIVPAFNAAARIDTVIDSVLSQTREDLELIVVDDGSDDGTAQRAAALARTDARLRVLGQANAGTVAARNAGIESATGRFISLLDDDDLWLPMHLEQAARAIGDDRGVGLCYGDAWVVDEPTGRVARSSFLQRFARPIRRLPDRLDPVTSLRALLRVNFIPTCSVTVSRPALEAVGRLDPGIRGCDDWDLWLRIAAAGFRIVRAPGRTAVLRKRADSVSADQRMMARNASVTLDRALRRGIPDSPAARIARRHKALIDREVAAFESTARVRGSIWRILRRLGRKRLRITSWTDAWQSPTGELRVALSRDRRRTPQRPD